MRCGPARILEMEIDLAVVRCGDQAAGPVHVRAGRRPVAVDPLIFLDQVPPVPDAVEAARVRPAAHHPLDLSVQPVVTK